MESEGECAGLGHVEIISVSTALLKSKPELGRIVTSMALPSASIEPARSTPGDSVGRGRMVDWAKPIQE